MSASLRVKLLSLFEATSSTLIPGSMRRSFDTIDGNTNTAMTSVALIHMLPSIEPARPEEVNEKLLAASPMARTCTRRSNPLGVSSSPLRQSRERLGPGSNQILPIASPSRFPHTDPYKYVCMEYLIQNSNSIFALCCHWRQTDVTDNLVHRLH